MLPQSPTFGDPRLPARFGVNQSHVSAIQRVAYWSNVP